MRAGMSVLSLTVPNMPANQQDWMRMASDLDEERENDDDDDAHSGGDDNDGGGPGPAAVSRSHALLMFSAPDDA